MPLHLLNHEIWFPPVTDALDDGLLAVGGDLSTERLLLAYHSGIFPWFDGDIPMWFSPDPRFVLFPGDLKVSKSMKALLKRDRFQFTFDKDFAAVISNCQTAPREGQDGTWITDDMMQAYIALHNMGYAHSAEVWDGDELVGGLYGILLGKVFFGESMFSRVSNASKYAFIRWVELLQDRGVALIDCQVFTDHLSSLGAQMIHRSDFMQLIQALIP